MEKNEMRLWILTVIRANRGDEESKEILSAQNELRKKQGRPTVEAELKAELEAIAERKAQEQEIKTKLKGIVLSSGQKAEDYVMSLPEKHREVATQAILTVSRKGWPLNDLEITSEGRAINRKRLGIK